MDILKNIRLIDLKERGATFIRDEEIKKDVCTGTIYYYFDKYDQEQSAADVTVRYFPRGGAEITGPHPNSSEGYDKLMEYLDKLSKEEYIRKKIVKRKVLETTFLALQIMLLVLIAINIKEAVVADPMIKGDMQIWEKIFIEFILLALIEYESEKSLRL